MRRSWLCTGPVATTLVALLLVGCVTHEPPAAATHEPITPSDVIYSVADGTAYRADLIGAVARPVDSVPVVRLRPDGPVGMQVPRVSPNGNNSAQLEAQTSEAGLHLTVVIKDLVTGSERSRYTFLAHLPDDTTMLQWSPSSQWLYVASDDEHVHVFDVDDPRRTVRVINVPNARNAFVASKDG